MIVRNYSKR